MREVSHVWNTGTGVLNPVYRSKNIAVATHNLTALGFCLVSVVVSTFREPKKNLPKGTVHGDAECWLDYSQFKDGRHYRGKFKFICLLKSHFGVQHHSTYMYIYRHIKIYQTILYRIIRNYVHHALHIILS